MTTSSANDPTTLPDANLLVDLILRRRLRDDVNAILSALQRNNHDMVAVRRLLASAVAIFGDEVVGELQRAIARGDNHDATAAIIVLRIIATEPARLVLWHVGRERHYSPLLQLDALRALCQLGETVAVPELVALANLCENLTPPTGSDTH